MLKLRKKLSLVMAFLLLLPSVTSCSDNGNTTDSNNETLQSSTENQVPSPEETEEEKDERQLVIDKLPTKDYEGYEFRVFTSYSNYAITMFDSESINGEVLNDTIYNRNRTVENNLNIKISNTQGPTGDFDFSTKQLVTMATAQDDMCDIMFGEAGLLAPKASDGYMINLYDIDDVNYGNIWWEQDATKHYNIKGKLYFTHSPMHLHYYESLVTPLFNKSIANDYGLGDIYEIVNSGKWTLDKMNELSAAVTIDQNGDGKMTATDDIFGFSASTNLLPYFPLCAGYRYTSTDADGNIVFNGADERLNSIAEKMTVLFGNHNNYIDFSTPGLSDFKSDFDPTGYIGSFISNRSLFYLDVLGRVKDLRGMDADFGILPVPKYDENQDGYKSTFYNGAAILVVPITNLKYREIGPILEQLGAYSYVDLIPQYYEVNIKGKQIRDVDSVPILEMMLGNITFDLCMTFSFGNIQNDYLSAVTNGKSIASVFASKSKMITKTIENMMKSYE